MHKPIDLRWWLLNNVAKLDHPEVFYNFFVIVSFTAFLFLSLSPILLAKVRKTGLKRLLLSDIAFIVSLCAFILAARWPGFLAPALNPDEALFISGAMKLLKDPVFWRSVETGSSGPLNIYPLTLPALFGFRLEYAIARVVGLCLVTTSVVCLYYSLRYLYGKAIARLSTMPAIVCIGLMTYLDYIHYSGEHVPIAILSIALLMLCKYYTQGSSSGKGLIFLFGFTIGLIPYAKLQALPMAFLLFCIFLRIVWVKNKAGDRFIHSLFILLAGATLFSGLFILYLVIFSLQGAFWETYIWGNLFYLNLASSQSFFDKIIGYLPYIRLIPDTNNLFGLTVFTLILGLPFLILRRRQTSAFVYYSLLFLVAACYSAIEPGRRYGHHLLFLIIPSGFLIGVFLAELWKILQAQGSIRRSLKLSLAIVVAMAIIVSSSIEFYVRIREDNPYIAMSRLFKDYYLNPIARAILKHASAGNTMVAWGWAPQLYVDSGLVQAMKSAHIYYELDYNSPQQQYFLTRFANAFLESKADIFVDAVSPVMFRFHDRKTQGHDAFPVVANIVKKYYTLADEILGVRIYVRSPR